MENKCPICGEPAVTSCRCIRSDSSCKNRHRWHYCAVHGTPVIGDSDHSMPMDVCTCDKNAQAETTKANIKFTTFEDRIRSYLEVNSDIAWSKMGDTGSESYVVNQESFNFGYYRALEDLESYIDNEAIK